MPNLNTDNLTVKENLIDRVIRFIDPVKAEQHFRARAMMAVSGSYIGASRAKRSLSQWRTSWGDADSDTLFDLPILRDRSRDLIRNAPLATGAINTVCTNVVGTGLKLQSRIDREALGMDEVEADELYRQIGQLKVELDWLKKNLNCSANKKKTLIEPGHRDIPLSRQYRLLGLSKGAYYYRPRPKAALNGTLTTLLDEQYTKTSFYGVPRMTEWLRTKGYKVNRKRVRRLMRLMGLVAVYLKPWLSKPAKDHKKYPYLLKGIAIERPDHVWSTDITYIRLRQGFIYLVAILDWHSRYVLSWEVSTTLDAEFCIRDLEKALSLSSPDIFNSDQGSQFTSVEFTGRLENLGVAISMDGRGRAMDNIFVERLWRTVKYEEVYLKSYETVAEVRESLARYFHFYNTERLHESLGYRTPREAYFKEQRLKETSEAEPRQALHQIQPSFLS